MRLCYLPGVHELKDGCEVGEGHVLARSDQHSKKRKTSDKDTGDDGEKKAKLDESFAEEIDNPFLRPVKMPRMVKTPK